jgi:hypothetical protein
MRPLQARYPDRRQSTTPKITLFPDLPSTLIQVKPLAHGYRCNSKTSELGTSCFAWFAAQ